MSEEYIKSELAKYNLPDAAISKMKAEYMPLKVESSEDMDGYVLCKERHQEVKKVRMAIEAKRKELKASSLEFGKAVDGEAKRLTAGVLEVEEHLLAQRKVVEDEKARVAAEKERLAREEEDRVKREEEERLETQRKEQEETARKQREAQDRIDAEKRQIEADKEKVRAEAERLEREKVEAEEAKARAAQEEIDRVEREKNQAEAMEKAKKEAAENAKKEEKSRIERIAREKEDEIRREKEEVERKALLAPDKEKLRVLSLVFSEIAFPEVKSPEAKGILMWAKENIEKVIEELENAKL